MRIGILNEKTLPHPRYPRAIWIGIGLALTWLIIALATYHTWIRGADHRDFYPRWAGVRLVLEGSRDVYSVSATKSIQRQLYGAEIPDDQDQQGFAYPANIIPILIPFALINDVEISTAAWEGFTVILLIVALILIQDPRDRRISGVPIVMFFFWGYPLLMIYQAQITGLVLAMLAIGYGAFRREKDHLAGLCLSISLVKPELVLLPVALLLTIGLIRRRYRFILSFSLSGMLLLLASILFVGWWIGDWISAIQRYSQYAKVLWPIGYLWDVNPVLGGAFILCSIALIVRVKKDEEALFASSIPLQMTFFPQTLTYGLTMLCLPLTIAWCRKSKSAVMAIWIVGWILLVARLDPEWWKIEFISMSLLSITVLMKMPIHKDRLKEAIKSTPQVSSTLCSDANEANESITR